MNGKSILGKQSTENDVIAVQEGAPVAHSIASDLDDDKAHKSDKIFGIRTQPHVMGEFTPLYMLSTWEKPDTGRVELLWIWFFQVGSRGEGFLHGFSKGNGSRARLKVSQTFG